MSQNHRDLRRAAMDDFLQSLAQLESTFVEPLEESPPAPVEPADTNAEPVAGTESPFQVQPPVNVPDTDTNEQ